MDYTKNHHLPQWAEEDRIMRTDFNQMCKDLEAGLDKGGTDLAAAETRINNRIAQGEQYATTLSTKIAVLEGLRRLAYNHMYLAALSPSVHQMDTFMQEFNSSAGNSISGMIQRPNYLWMCHETNVLSLDTVRPTLNVSQKNDSTTYTLTISFTAPASGYLDFITLLVSYYNNPGNVGLCKMTLHETNKYTVVWEKEDDLHMSSGSTDAPYERKLSVDALLRAGTPYRLTIFMRNLPFVADIILDPKRENCMGFHTANTPTASLQRTMTSEGSRSGGLAVVHYTTGGTGGKPTLTWSGEALQPAVTRRITDNKRQTVMEAEFHRDTTLPASSTIKLNLSCNTGGEICLYRWGAILL